MASPIPREIGRLEATFSQAALSSHGSHWDSLWKESYTPWDRGGPSLALRDLIVEHPELIPPSTPKTRKTALVPGCGRGYDVLLLASLGYDVMGLDYSAAATKEALENEKKVGGDAIYTPREGVTKGMVAWMTGDFFGNEFWKGMEPFDVIFDYTFFCALPPEARPKWARGMSQLLKPDTGRLICLEWPLHKAADTNGPPWGLTPETYLAHLSRPGEEISYGDDGRVSPDALSAPRSADGLVRLDRVKPKRTHKSGIDEEGNIFDFISVWARPAAGSQ